MTNEVNNDDVKGQAPEFIHHVNRINQLIDSRQDVLNQIKGHGVDSDMMTHMDNIEKSIDLAYIALEIQLLRATLEGIGVEMLKPKSRIIT